VYDLGPDGIYGTEDDGGEFQVTDDPANQKPQFIWGRNLVWTDYRNGKITGTVKLTYTFMMPDRMKDSIQMTTAANSESPTFLSIRWYGTFVST